MKGSRGIVLLDTMLALGVFALSAVTAVAMIAEILHAQSKLAQVDRLELKMMAARQKIADADYTTVAENVAGGRTWVIDSAARAKSATAIAAQAGLGLEVTLTTDDGQPLTSFGCIKNP